MLLSILEKAINKKGIKESDPFDWEKTPGDISQATTTTSTPPVGQIYTTPPDNKAGLHNLHGSERVSTGDMLDADPSDHNNEAHRKDSVHKNGNSMSKLGTTDKGVIQKIREVLDAVERDSGHFLKPQTGYGLHREAKQVCTWNVAFNFVNRDSTVVKQTPHNHWWSYNPRSVVR